MKLSEIKKELGNKGKLVWIETDNGADGFSLVYHPHEEVKYGYDPACMYAFEKFINCDDFNSIALNAIKRAFGVTKVFAFQDVGYGTDSLDKTKFVKLGENRTHEFYDSDCSFLVLTDGKNDVVGNEYDGVAFV
jgi:hypothetical protein